MPYTIVTQPNCHACQQAKKLIEEKGFRYNEYDITEYRHTFIRSLLSWSGVSTVPQIWDNEGHYVGGYEELKYADELR